MAKFGKRVLEAVAAAVTKALTDDARCTRCNEPLTVVENLQPLGACVPTCCDTCVRVRSTEQRRALEDAQRLLQEYE